MTKQMKIKICMILAIVALTFQQGHRNNHVVMFGLLLMVMLLFHRHTLLKYYGNGFLGIIIYTQVELDILKQNLIQSLFFFSPFVLLSASLCHSPFFKNESSPCPFACIYQLHCSPACFICKYVAPPQGFQPDGLLLVH